MSAGHHVMTLPSLPSAADSLEELLSLQASGETVQWPKGYDAQMARQFVAFDRDGTCPDTQDSRDTTPPHSTEPYPVERTTFRNPVDTYALAQMLELHKAGIAVNWPSGFDVEKAQLSIRIDEGNALQLTQQPSNGSNATTRTHVDPSSSASTRNVNGTSQKRANQGPENTATAVSKGIKRKRKKAW